MISLEGYIAGLSSDSVAYKVAFEAACDESNSLGDYLVLPSGETVLPHTVYCDKIIGSTNSVLVVPHTSNYFGFFYGVKNSSYSEDAVNRPIPRPVSYKNFALRTTWRSGFHLANVADGEILGITAYADMVGVAADHLIGFHACCKNVKVSDCRFHTISGAHGTGGISDPGGGGAIWVRNLVAGFGRSHANETSGIIISNCSFAHKTSDEAVAFFGCTGAVRDCHISHSTIIATRDSGNPEGEATHKVLVSFFPGKNLGNSDAEVSNCSISHCDITDLACGASVIRAGHFLGDENQYCYDIQIVNNAITAEFVSNESSAITNTERLYPDEYNDSHNTISGNVITNNSKIVPSAAFNNFPRSKNNIVHGQFRSHYAGCGILPSDNPQRLCVDGKLRFIY